MNKYLPIISVLTIINLTSCSKQLEPKYAVISGIVKNGEKSLIVYPPFSQKPTNNKVHKIQLNTDGSFHDTLYIQEGEHTIFDGTNAYSFYLTPSNKYTLSYDLKTTQKNGIQLGGDDVVINQYFIDKMNNRVFFNPVGDGKNEVEFRQFINTLKNKNLERLTNAKLPPAMGAIEKEIIEYEYLRQLFLYLAFNDIKKPTEASKQELDINYLDEDRYKRNGQYNALVYEHFFTQLRQIEQLRLQNDASYTMDQYKIQELAQLVPNEYIRNSLIAQSALFGLKEAPDFKAFYKDFQDYYTGEDEQFINEMTDLFMRLSALEKGTPSPKFKNYDNYKGGLSSLDDFKGKYVFIDLWATWCGNCVTQMPALKVLEKEYANKNIAFVSIAWRDNKKKWQQAIAQNELPGVQLFANEANDDFFERYGVYGIPRYILVDDHGKIVNYNAPRPSETTEIRALFESVGL